MFPVMRILFASSIAMVVAIGTAHAEDPAMQNWEALPEDPGLAPYCVLDKKFSAALAALKAKGATPTQMMRWGETEAEKYEAENPENPLLPLGAQAKIIEMILTLEALGEYPSEGYPGFPEFAYRSCLKGKPIGQKHP
jgi:hypothetical protein